MLARLSIVLDKIILLFGALFCLQWTIALLVFPIYKERLSGYLPIIVGLVVGLLFCSTRLTSSITRKITNVSPGVFLLGTTLMALSIRLIAVALFPIEPVNDHLFFHRYAVNILNGKGFGGLPWPGLPHLGYRVYALYPPGMSFLLASWYWLTTASVVAGKIVNCLIGTGMVLLLYDIGRRILGNAAGRWAALIAAVLPTLVFYSASLGYEIVLATLLLSVIDFALVVLHLRGLWRWLVVAAIGVLLGVGCLVKPICLLVPFLLLAWWLLLGVGWRAWLFAATSFLFMFSVILPWTLRNERIFNRFVLISTNGGCVLYSANNPEATGVYMTVRPLPGEVDEVAMDRLRRQAGVRWIVGHPVQFLRLAFVKAVVTWGTSSTIMSFISCDRMAAWQENICMGLLNVGWTALLIVCIFSTATTPIWRQRKLYLAFAMLMYLFLIHLVAEAESRHYIPVLGTLILIAAYGISCKSRKQEPSEESELVSSGEERRSKPSLAFR